MLKKNTFITLLLLILFPVVNVWGLKLELNGERFIPGDRLQLSLIKTWEGTADLWIAVKLPEGSLFYLTPSGFGPNPTHICWELAPEEQKPFLI